MKILCGAVLISIFVFFIGWQSGISFERKNKNHPSPVIKFDGQIESVTSNEIKIFNALSSGRMKAYVVIRGEVAIKNYANTHQFIINNQNEFIQIVKGYFGIDDDQVIKGIMPNSGLWFVIENQSGNRILYSKENSVVFTEMQ